MKLLLTLLIASTAWGQATDSALPSPPAPPEKVLIPAPSSYSITLGGDTLMLTQSQIAALTYNINDAQYLGPDGQWVKPFPTIGARLIQEFANFMSSLIKRYPEADQTVMELRAAKEKADADLAAAEAAVAGGK